MVEGLVRASNATPCLTLRFEGDTEQDLAKVADQFRTWLGKVCPQVPLNF